MISQVFLFKMIMFSLLSAFFIGPYLLESIGVQYVSEGGNPLFKIHLYSYVIIILFTLSFLTGGLNQYLRGLGELKSYWFTSIACITFVIVYGLFRQGMSGMAYIVDTVLTPLLLAPLVFSLNTSLNSKILKLLAWLILLNSFVAIIEFILNKTLIYTDFLSFGHFRSTAFLSHPLNNALITATLAPMLMNKTRLSAIVYFFVVLLSLFAYGGRGAMAVFIAASAAITFPQIREFFTVGIRIQRLRFALYQLGFICILLCLFAVILITPIGDRILSKLFIDNSAQTRLDVFYILYEMNMHEWVFGGSENLKYSISSIIGQKTIENYLIGWIVSFGLIGTIPLLMSVFTMPIKIVSKLGLNEKVSLLSFLVISITNNALAVKTTALLFIITVLVCLLQKKK